MTNGYLQRLLPVAHRDPVVGAAFVRVIAMLARPSELMHPRILTRVRAWALARIRKFLGGPGGLGVAEP